MNRLLQLVIVMVVVLGLKVSANALTIASVTFENAFIEVANEIQENGGITTFERPSAGIDRVINPVIEDNTYQVEDTLAKDPVKRKERVAPTQKQIIASKTTKCWKLQRLKIKPRLFGL